jgi:hypothetical protein
MGALEFRSQIDTEKMMQVVREGGANPSLGPVGLGVLLRKNKNFTMMWRH